MIYCKGTHCPNKYQCKRYIDRDKYNPEKMDSNDKIIFFCAGNSKGFLKNG